MIDRLVRAIKLDPRFYREVAGNPAYTTESFWVVLVVAVISSLGVLFSGQRAALGFVAQVANSLLFGWLLWAGVAYLIGTGVFGGRSNMNEMLRTLGYANAPRLLGVFSFIPCIGWIIALVGWLLSLAAGVIAIREAMEFDTTKAVVTAVVGLMVYLIASLAIGFIFAALAAPFR